MGLSTTGTFFCWDLLIIITLARVLRGATNDFLGHPDPIHPSMTSPNRQATEDQDFSQS
jgi:hypothetical protein